MQTAIKLILSPLAFAIGFLWPLITQVLVAADLMPAGWPAIAAGAAIALTLGVIAQLRGSWIWIK